MILITGGAFQGKLECAKEIWREQNSGEPVILQGKTCDPQELMEGTCDILDHMTDFVRRMMEIDQDPEPVLEQLIQNNPKVILESKELGCGLVPIDAFDRRYREAHGRLCCRLAKKAEAVYRVSCGLAMRIK